MTRYKILVQYVGTSFSGWQRQVNTKNTIQGKIEDVLTRMADSDIKIDGASRTDQGVHARGQVASFLLPSHFETTQIRDYLNNYLPKSIGVTKVEEVDYSFHARHDAKSKEYVYRIWNSPVRNVFEDPFVLTYKGEIDLELMQKASTFFVGKKDFRAYATKVPKKKSSVRTLYSLRVEKEDDELSLTFLGDGFLYNMIRIISGTLLDVGTRKISIEDIEKGYVGPCLPSLGLTLSKINY